MKKVLSLVLSLVLVLGMMPVFAVEDMGSAGENLKHYEFITGGTGGDLMEDKEFTREQLAKILAELNGKAEEAAAFEGTVNFKDADKIGAWALPYVAYAVEQDWLVGNDKNEFMPKGIVSGKELLTAMLRVLGYETEWATVVEEAAEVGFTASEGELTRGQAFETIWTVVSEIPAKGSDVALGVELGKLEADKPAELDFTVSATNLKEVMVEFNQEINKETVVDSNFTIKLGNASKAASARLLEDGKTVVLSAKDLATGKFENQKDYTLTVEKVKSAEGVEIAKVTKDFSVFDGTLPTVDTLAYTGPKQVELTFSEPIAKVGTVTIKTGNSSISVNSGDINGLGTNVLQIPVFSTFKDATTYSVTVTGFEDFAGYANVVKTFEQEYVKDVTPPTASVVKATQEYVVVEFDKPVTGLTPQHFSHTFTAWNSIRVTEGEALYKDNVKVDNVSPSKAYKQVVVWFHDAKASTDAEKAANRPIEAGTRTLNILTKANNVEIKDLWSNKLAEANLTFEVSADTTAPEVKEIKIATERSFTVEFTKNVSFTKDNIEILDADGKAISGLFVQVSDGPKKYTIDLGKDYPGKTFIVNLKNVKDQTLLTNTMPTYSETITVGDKSAPKVDKVTYKVDGDNKYVFVFFNEDMGADTTLVAGNYQLLKGDTYTKLSNTPEFVNGVKTVKILLTKTEAAAYDGGANKMFIDNVKDVAGNVIEVKVTGTIQAHDEAIKPVIALEKDNLTKKVRATGTKAIKVYFDQELASVDTGAFTVTGNEVVGIELELVDGKTVATLALKNAIADPAAINSPVTLVAEKVTNLFGVKNAEEAGVAAQDFIAPVVATENDKAKITTDVNGHIIIEFTEDLAEDVAGTLYAQDIVLVKGATTLTPGTDYVAVSQGPNNKITIKKNVGGDALADGAYKVYSKDAITYIKDAHDNKAAKFTTAFDITVDATAPQIASANENATATVLTVTFNEAMDKAKVETAGNWSVTLGASQANVVSVSLDATGKVATVTFDAALIDANVVTVANVTDVLGNPIDAAKDAVVRGNEATGSGVYTVQ